MPNTVQMPQEIIDDIVDTAWARAQEEPRSRVVKAAIDAGVIPVDSWGGPALHWSEIDRWTQVPFVYSQYWLSASMMSGLRPAVRRYVATGQWTTSWWVGTNGPWGRQVFGGMPDYEVDELVVEALLKRIRDAIDAKLDAENDASRRAAERNWSRQHTAEFAEELRTAKRHQRLGLLKQAAAQALTNPEWARELRERQAAIK